MVMDISLDSQAILLLCSQMNLAGPSDAEALTLRDWNPLARKIQASDIQRPGSLLGMSAEELQNALSLSQVEAARLSQLLDRCGFLEAELQRLASLGIHPLTRVDANYPGKLRQRLRDSSPAVLFYAGNAELLGQPGIAVVGSRRLDQAGQECAAFIGNTCGLSGLVLYSGGAKGVDTISMQAALDARGTAVGLLADSLEKAVRVSHWKLALKREDLCLVTAYSPNAVFSVGAAMGRNRMIYALSDFAIVVASDAHSGGTWAGATEALKTGWVTVFVMEHAGMPEGNRLLLERGGLAFPQPFPEHYSRLKGWLEEKASQLKRDDLQPGLF